MANQRGSRRPTPIYTGGRPVSLGADPGVQTLDFALSCRSDTFAALPTAIHHRRKAFNEHYFSPLTSSPRTTITAGHWRHHQHTLPPFLHPS